jgi:transcriptional regulator with XRE-family HTH domain
MKRFHSLGEFLVDFRKHRNLTQLDFSVMLEVDVRTIIRWEKNESLIKAEKENLLIENFGIPHQVMRNLNTDLPLPVYFDFERWMYSLNLLSSVVRSSKEFKSDIEHETSRIETLKEEKDFNFISLIQQNQMNATPINLEVLKTAAQILPELNLVIHDHSGFHGGHISVLPLKFETYNLIRDKKLKENQLTLNNLTRFPDQKQVFYFYSLYSNSKDNIFYLINRLLYYFKKRQLKDYVFAGITFQKLQVERFREAGFQVIWEEQMEDYPEYKATFLSGNFDEFLYSDE